jgi:HD-like signal output (HDOD) protein/CheY-like chemotaxis protein
MKNILIAGNNNDEVVVMTGILDDFFQVSTISSPILAPSHMDEVDLLFLDDGFTPDSGLDFMKNILSLAYIPVILLTSPDNLKSAADALQSGAYNYIVKVPGYEQLLTIAASEAIRKFNERKNMKETIVNLKKRISELESRLDSAGSSEYEALTDSAGENTERTSGIFDEITQRLNQGEINLPPAPGIISLFSRLVDQGANYHQIAELLKKDIAIAAKLIMVSNSPIYRGLSENKSVEQAISRLGIGVTEQYVYVISNRALYTSGHRQYMPFIERLWEHSLATAYASQAISDILRLQLSNDAFSIGLFHDIGKLMLFQVIGELEIKGRFSPPLEQREVLDILETYHAPFGANLLKRWNFPGEYLQTATYHDSLQEAESVSRELLAVHFSNKLAHNLGYSLTEKDTVLLDALESSRQLNITPEVIARAIVQVQLHMKNAALIFAT